MIAAISFNGGTISRIKLKLARENLKNIFLVNLKHSILDLGSGPF
jgi:hypothetical protein